MRKIILTIAAIMLAFPTNAVNWNIEEWPPRPEDGWINCGTNGCKVCEVYNKSGSCSTSGRCELKMGTTTIKIVSEHASCDSRGGCSTDDKGNESCNYARNEWISVKTFVNEAEVAGRSFEGGWHGGTVCDHSRVQNALNDYINSKITELIAGVANGECKETVFTNNAQITTGDCSSLNDGGKIYFEVTKCNLLTKPEAANPLPANSGTFTQYCGLDG